MLFFRSGFASQVTGTIKYFSKKLSTETVSSPVVTVTQGKLRGVVSELCDGSAFYSFKGIPYARPPVGELRFKAPQPPAAWSGVREADAHGPPCPQVELLSGQYSEGSEDCLFLNVYTKALSRDVGAAVMVFIHGGAFMSGSGDDLLYGPRFLLQHDVVLVTVNYRLECLGFLCLDTPEVPGNAGMKDQVAAMRWVRDNIERFGGDPNNVTIFGESAGAASVTYHMLSPMSAGLFHRVVAQSGVCTADWARGAEGRARAVRAARLLGADSDDPAEVLRFLQGVPVDKLPRLTFSTLAPDERHRGLPMHFVPVVEKRFRDVEAFLADDPLDLLVAGKINTVPLLVGYNSSEGLMMVNHQIKKIDFLNKNPSYLVPREIAQKVPSDVLMEFGNSVKEFYAGARGLRAEDVEALAQLNSDVHFVYPCHRFCALYDAAAAAGAAERRALLYRFDCDTELNAFKRLLGHAARAGACHVDELFYLFDNAATRDSYAARPDLRAAVRAVTALWTHFARTGELPPGWRAGAAQGLRVARGRAAGAAEGARVAFWNRLYRRAGLPALVASNL